jgi:hypothetical protein
MKSIFEIVAFIFVVAALALLNIYAYEIAMSAVKVVFK